MEFIYKNRTFKIEGVAPNDHIYQVINRKKSFYEIDLLEYMRFIMWSRQRNNSVGIDVGANIGNHSIFFGNFLCNHVISIEPNNRVHSVLLKNLNNNNINFTVYKYAIGKAEGVGRIVIDETQNNIGTAKVVSEVSGGSGGGIVNIQTLDYLLDNYLPQNYGGNVIFIKIDVEGMELEVLQGARQIIDLYKPDLFIETSAGKELYNIEDYLRGLCYSRVTRYPFAVTPVHHFAHNKTVFLKQAMYRYYMVMKMMNKTFNRIFK